MGCCGSAEKKPGDKAKPAKPAKKDRMLARRKLLNEGKAGSLGIALDENMVVKSVKGSSGLKAGDLVVVVSTTEEDDDFDDNDKEQRPVRNRRQFMEACGPRSDIFEGCTLPITVIRDAADQKAFQEKAKSLSKDKAWLSEVKKMTTQTFKIKVMPETEGVRNTRLKKIRKIKDEKKLKDLDVDLVVNFMSDPRAARLYSRKVFDAADKDKSGTLTKDEVVNVFTEITAHTGCKVPSKGDIKDLFKLMDLNGSGHITFDEFFPIFRWKTIALISDMLDDED
eukprot:TRINITY_DN3668_c0_g1_i1.p1 TRINITY_DN3668_c0_g1~~TRINITY_DN3668_c0_g1_i1.p1  ORF type:complete len:300 (+),score=155.35 TRINITY_DN3668_c0_g1_i1:58-900(+)